MSGQRRRNLSGAGVAVAVLVLVAGCSGDGEPATRGASEPSPSALSTEDVFLEDQERPKVEAVWDDFAEAYDSGDWATVVSLTSSEGIAYFRQLQKSAASAGPEVIREMDTYQRAVIATLRGAGDHDQANAPTDEFLTLLHGNRILGGGPGELRDLRIQRIQVLGDMALTRIWQSPTTAWEIDFELEGGEWKVDLSDIAYIAGDAFETIAARRDIPLDRLILALASKVAGEPVTEAVWQRP